MHVVPGFKAKVPFAGWVHSRPGVGRLPRSGLDLDDFSHLHLHVPIPGPGILQVRELRLREHNPQDVRPDGGHNTDTRLPLPTTLIEAPDPLFLTSHKGCA